MSIILDTNILVRLKDGASPERANCAAVMNPIVIARTHLRICTQVMIEYWVVATRPVAVNGLGLTPAQADMDLDDVLKIIPLIPEPPLIGARWRQIVRQHGVSGREAHDARLVAIAIESGARDNLESQRSRFCPLQ